MKYKHNQLLRNVDLLVGYKILQVIFTCKILLVYLSAYPRIIYPEERFHEMKFNFDD